MIDKSLLRLLGDNKKYIFYTVGLMVLGLFANIGITASICWAISLAVRYGEYSGGAEIFIFPAACAAVGIAVRYVASRLVGELREMLGRKVKKELRERVYSKIVRLGVRSTDGMSMAGLTQVSLEGVEQLDLYYSSYIPQFFYAMLAPFILFGVTVWIEWRVAVLLLCCVPLIPVSIIAVSKYAKRVFAKYWGKYTSMGDSFLDSVQGLKELKIFRADEARHAKMHAEKGEIIGIVGESGCGKSTFLKLLLRFWQKNHGEIAYNGVDIDSLDGDSLLDNVTMVSQVTYLFDETIEDNLRIARPTATQEEIEAACRLAAVHDFILSLPDGYKTRVGALGDNLSAGEKQRIGLARAFLRGSELILLDEPTSNVDSINEGIILKALREQKNKRSIILVSHRESTMAIADRIYRVEGGRMHETA